MDRHDSIDIARPRSDEVEDVPLEKVNEKDINMPVDDNVTILGAGDENGHELATKA